MQDASATRLRAALDLAIDRLAMDSQLLEAAGLSSDSEDSHLCALMLRSIRAEIIRLKVAHCAPI